MQGDDVLISAEGALGRVVLNRPDCLNALTPAMARAILAALTEFGDDASIRVVILTGSGTSFCAGADVDVLGGLRGAESVAKLIRPFNDLIRTMRHLDKPIVAAVRGHAAGGGISLALASDLVVASSEARFSFAYPRLGLSQADLGTTYFLPRVVGLTRASELLLTGAMVTAPQALAMGMVNRVVADEDLASAAAQLAESIAVHSPISSRITKMAVNRGLHMDLGTDLEYETYLQTFCMLSQDFQEGLEAFRERRAPDFRGV